MEAQQPEVTSRLELIVWRIIQNPNFPEESHILVQTPDHRTSYTIIADGSMYGDFPSIFQKGNKVVVEAALLHGELKPTRVLEVYDSKGKCLYQSQRNDSEHDA
jgi:cytochrome c-type biogenesis protein CcmE